MIQAMDDTRQLIQGIYHRYATDATCLLHLQHMPPTHAPYTLLLQATDTLQLVVAGPLTLTVLVASLTVTLVIVRVVRHS